MYRLADLPPVTAPMPQMRSETGRVIEIQYEITDDIVREVRSMTGQRIRPMSFTTRINLDSGFYAVDIVGPPLGQRSGVHDFARFVGSDFRDADEHNSGFAVNCVIACLDAHGLVER